MKHSTPTRIRTKRGFLATLVSFIIFIVPLTPVTYASTSSKIKSDSQNTVSPKPATSDRSPVTTTTTSANAANVAVVNPAAPLVFTPSITATKTDTFTDSDGDGKAVPGEEITYNVTITNNGTTAATGVTFNDNYDSNTTLVAGSVNTQPIAFNDVASAFGNVRISTANGAPNLIANDRDPDVGNGASSGLTVTAIGTDISAPFSFTTSNGGQVTSSTQDGSFEFNPAPGFTGDDTFTYTVTDAKGATDTATVQITVGPTLIWFINNDPAAPAGNDGRITSPFNSIASYNASAPSKDANDIIFIYTGTSAYTGGLTLTSGMKVIGQGFALQTETGAPPAGSEPLPGAGTSPTINNPNATIIALNQNNTLRGFNTGNSGSSGTDISGTSFGTLTISHLSIGGDGRALNLTTGTLAAAIGSISASNTGTNAGLVMNGVGGALTVSGTTFIANPGGTGIDVSNSPAGANHTFGTTTVNKDSTAGVGVNLSSNLGTTSFSALVITTSNGIALNTNNAGTVNTSGGGSLTAAGGAAASLTSTVLGVAFNSVSSNGGTNGIFISGGSGSFASGTTNLQNNAGAGLSMASSSVAANFGNTTVNSSAGIGVSLTSNTGNITFGDLTITPDANFGGLVATGHATGTITATSGVITTSGAAAARAVSIDGAAVANRAPINLTFNSITTTGVTESIRLVNVSGTKFQVTGTTQINTRAGTGILVENSTAATLQFATVNIPNVNNAGGYGIRVGGSSSAVTVATTTINNANLTSGQTDGNSDFIPDNDGDGDAIFLKDNTGSFTLNGGTLSNCGNDCIDVRNSNNLVLSGVTINTPGIDVSGASGSGTGGHGIQAIDLKGTSSITGSTITNFDTAARDGARFINSGSTTLTLTIGSTTFSDSSGSNGVFISGRGSSVVNTTINNNCVFTGLFGAAITHNAGDSLDSTATSNITVQNNSFTNAPTNGSNTVSARNIEGAKATVNISNNTFTNIAQTASSNTGAITVNGDGTDAGNQLTLTIQNNTMSGIGNSTSACGAGATPCDGYYGMLVFIDDQTIVNGTILIDGNNVTNVRRTGLKFDVGHGPAGSNVNARITNNTYGTAAAPVGQVGQSGVDLFARCLNGASGQTCANTTNLAFTGNTVTNNSSTGTLTTTVYARVEDDANFQITATGNTLRNLGTREEWTARSAFPIASAPLPVMCLDMNGNQLDSGAGVIVLDEDTGTTLNVEQASAAGLAAANGIPAGNVTVFGAPNFGVACATPPAAPEEEIIVSDEEASLRNDIAPAQEQNADTVAADTTTEVETSQIAAFSNVGMLTDNAPSARRNDTADAVYFGKIGATQRRARNNHELEGDAHYGRAAQQNSPVTASSEGGDEPQPLAPLSAINIGTLNPGDSVTITFKVTVNDPLPGGVTQVSNQGQVSGSNFATVNTDDPATGAAGDPTVTPIQPPPDIFVRNATVSEPAAGSSNMTFTVVLSLPTTNTVTVNFSTADGGANPATAGSDYTTTTGTVTFAPGERVQTISVPVLADADTSETDETFLVNLSTPVNGIIVGAQAVGTIKPTSDPGTVIISELRTSGPGTTGTGDANDEFVEIYNNTDSPITVTTTDGSTGWALVKSGATCGATPVIIGVIPNNTTIPARGHYLFVGSGYSLGSYASGNQTMTGGGIEDDHNVALFNTSNLINFASTTRLDAVGFGTNTANNCDLLREASTLAEALGSITQYSFVRKFNPANGRPFDTNVNASDFMVVSTTGAAVGNNPTPVLGAPGPENLASPIVRGHSPTGISSQLLDPATCSACAPNREKSLTPVSNGPQGTLTIRRTFTNNTGGDVTRLRFRIIDITTLNSPNAFGGQTQSDLRALNSNDSPAVTTTGGPVLVRGTTIETPPAQPNGGGVNSSYTLTTPGVIVLGTPLPNGGSVNVQFVLGIVSNGKFNFFINIEALP